MAFQASVPGSFELLLGDALTGSWAGEVREQISTSRFSTNCPPFGCCRGWLASPQLRYRIPLAAPSVGGVLDGANAASPSRAVR